jgi:predicted HicB family RNase H-like nuclease
MKKLLEQYLKLPYVIEVKPIPEEEGGGFTAYIPELGELAFIGDGETAAEAIADLEKTKREKFEQYLKEQIAIPAPQRLEDFSGRFVVRIPKKLHRELAYEAKMDDVSLNQYVNNILAGRFKTPEIVNYLKKLESQMQRIDYAIQTQLSSEYDKYVETEKAA